MNKSKNNRLLYAIIAGIIIVISLLIALIVQNHENSPAIQESRREESSVKASESSDASSESEYKAEKAAIEKKMKNAPKGNYLYLSSTGIYRTTWSREQLQQFIDQYQAASPAEAAKITTNLGTSQTYRGDDYDDQLTLSSLHVDGVYYTSAYSAYKANPGIDTIVK